MRDLVYIQKTYSYNAETGEVTKKSKHPRCKGKVIKGKQITGRTVPKLSKKKAIWLLYYGEWPTTHGIYHKDGDPTNYRIDNLTCTRPPRKPKEPEKRKVKNKPILQLRSGSKHISWVSTLKRWLVVVPKPTAANPKRVQRLGFFEELPDAQAALVAAGVPLEGEDTRAYNEAAIAKHKKKLHKNQLKAARHYYKRKQKEKKRVKRQEQREWDDRQALLLRVAQRQYESDRRGAMRRGEPPPEKPEALVRAAAQAALSKEVSKKKKKKLKVQKPLVVIPEAPEKTPHEVLSAMVDDWDNIPPPEPKAPEDRWLDDVLVGRADWVKET